MLPQKLAFVVAILVCSVARAQTIDLVSVSSSGVHGDFDSINGAVSADGRFVAFVSRSHNFSPNDPDGPNGPDNDVYLRDRVAGTTTHVSIAFPTAFEPNISADGAYVTYETGDFTSHGLGIARCWVFDRATGIEQPLMTGDFETDEADLSADGRYIAFAGRDASGTDPYSWPPWQAYRLDRTNGTVMLLSRTPNGNPSNGSSYFPSISADGSRVAFSSVASDLVPHDTNGVSDVFVFDVPTRRLARVSVDASGVEGDQGSYEPAFSADGHFVAFFSAATNLVAGDTNMGGDLFRHEMSTGNIERLSLSSSGQQVFGNYNLVKLSADGRLAYFGSDAPDLVSNDTDFSWDVFVRDTAQGTTRRLSEGPGGLESNGNSWFASSSRDGRFVAFYGYASNLGPTDVNGVQDVYLLDRGPVCSATSYCTALPNSTGNFASIGSQGDASASLNQFALSCSHLPAHTSGHFFLGTTAIDPGTPFGNGLLCAGGNVVRLPNVHVAGGTVTQLQNLSSPAYAGIQPGNTRYFQFVYRNVAAGGAGFNTSDALAITFCP